MTISEKLKYRRDSLKITRKEAAKRIGTDPAWYGKWESGAVSPDAVSILKIAKGLNVSVDWLIDDSDDSLPKVKCAPEGKKKSRYLYNCADGKQVCTAEYCGWAQNCGNGLFTCPGKGCMRDLDYKTDSQDRLITWFLQMFDLLAQKDFKG